MSYVRLISLQTKTITTISQRRLELENGFVFNQFKTNRFHDGPCQLGKWIRFVISSGVYAKAETDRFSRAV